MSPITVRRQIPRPAANKVQGTASVRDGEPVAAGRTSCAVPPGGARRYGAAGCRFDIRRRCPVGSFMRNLHPVKMKPQARDVTVSAVVAVTSVALTLGAVSLIYHDDTTASGRAPVHAASTPIVPTNECPGLRRALIRAPGPPDDPYRVVGQNWPQGDSCELIEEMMFVDNAEPGFPTWQMPAALKNAQWAAEELVQHAGGLLGVTIPDDMGVSIETVERSLIEASRAIRDTKERITGIVATVNATMRTGEPDVNRSTGELMLGGQRERIAAARKQLDARLHEIGSAVRAHLIPGGEPAQDTYLVWNEQGVTNVVDRQGYALDSDTNGRISSVPFVTLPPVEPVKRPARQGRT